MSNDKTDYSAFPLCPMIEILGRRYGDNRHLEYVQCSHCNRRGMFSINEKLKSCNFYWYDFYPKHNLEIKER